MSQKTNDQLRSALVAILIRDRKKAAYWKTHFTIRMTDETGALLYEILGKEKDGWIQFGNEFYLSGCKCKTAQIKKKGGTIYRDFQPCPSHVHEIVELLKRAMITVRPALTSSSP